MGAKPPYSGKNRASLGEAEGLSASTATQPAADTLERTGGAVHSEVVELAGAIKWFDVSKGFGFVVPDEDLPDVLLHVTCLRKDGFNTVLPGARIVIEAVQRDKGWQALRVLSMDESTATPPQESEASRTHVTVQAESPLERVQVKWFNRIRGYGFLTRGSGTPDIFVHMETLRRFGFTELRQGQTLLVRFGNGPKGVMAAELKPDGPGGFSSH